MNPVGARVVASIVMFAVIAAPVLLAAAESNQVTRIPRPNILWLSSEDHGPHLGCDGDKYAVTPPALRDHSSHVRIVAGQILRLYGTADDLSQALPLLLDLSDAMKHDVFIAVAALTALETLGERTQGVADAIRLLPANGKVPDPRYSPYVPSLLKNLQAQLGRTSKGVN